MWKQAVRDISEGNGIVGLGLSLECHPCAMAVSGA